MAWRIPLTRGYFAIVDDDDAPWILRSTWYASVHPDGRVYAVRKGGPDDATQSVAMHRDILRPRPGFVTDHINHDGLDNQRANLREATPSQNRRNVNPDLPCVSRGPSQQDVILGLLRATNGGAVTDELIAAVLWVDRLEYWKDNIASLVRKLRRRGAVIRRECTRGVVSYQLMSEAPALDRAA